jgi:hypothetical protein
MALISQLMATLGTESVFKPGVDIQRCVDGPSTARSKM